jgi:hypothetical protein
MPCDECVKCPYRLHAGDAASLHAELESREQEMQMTELALFDAQREVATLAEENQRLRRQLAQVVK